VGDTSYGDGTWKVYHSSAKTEGYIDSLGLKISAGDVEKFSIIMTEFEHEDMFGPESGKFLRALVRVAEGTNFTIHTKHWERPLSEMYAVGSKRIKVIGDVFSAGAYYGGGELEIEGKVLLDLGEHMTNGRVEVDGVAIDEYTSIGSGMEGGIIIIRGNIGNCAGNRMKGGIVIIKGNAGDFIGGAEYSVSTPPLPFGRNPWRTDPPNGMEGGTIRVEGNAGKLVGNHMRGGEIHLEGSYVSLGTVYHGRIYHKGKLIVDK
jgi:formylmethanofuran dehydrogenase subunit C